MHSMYDQDDFPPEFLNDVLIAISTIMILAPFLSLAAIERMIPAFKKAIERGVRICVFIQKPLGWDNRKGASGVQLAKIEQLETGIRLLHSIGVHVTMRDKVHVKIAVIDLAIFWHGSLNMLSFNPSLTDDEMIREVNVFEACAAIGRQKLDKCATCVELRRKIHREDFVIQLPTIGRVLRQFRKWLGGISQKDLAGLCDMNRKTIERIEKGDTIPQLETLIEVFGNHGHHLVVVPSCALPFIENFLELATYAFPEKDIQHVLSKSTTTNAALTEGARSTSNTRSNC